MMNITTLTQVKAFARQDGVFLALLWIASFLLKVYFPLSIIGSLLALATPFFVGWLLIRFRNYALNGNISFWYAFLFSCYTFFYGALLFTAAQFVYFRFFDDGAMMNMMHQMFTMIEETYKNQDAATTEMLSNIKDGISMIGQASPIELAFIFMMENIFFGFFLSFPIAFFCRRSKRY